MVCYILYVAHMIDAGKIDLLLNKGILMKSKINTVVNELVNHLVYADSDSFETGEISDGFHTFSELYAFRQEYNRLLFNEWGRQGLYQVHKSKRHNDGELCFDGGYFIVVAMLPSGQISNHYPLVEWDRFVIPEEEKANFEFDGHDALDVLERLKSLN